MFRIFLTHSGQTKLGCGWAWSTAQQVAVFALSYFFPCEIVFGSWVILDRMEEETSWQWTQRGHRQTFKEKAKKEEPGKEAGLL